MVIDESGLEKALKNAYKGEGYKVAVKTNRGGGLEMCFGGDGWEAAVNRDNVPRKVLGMIAEHLGTLPELGEAFQISKDESQTEIFQMSLGADEQPDEQGQGRAHAADGRGQHGAEPSVETELDIKNAAPLPVKVKALHIGVQPIGGCVISISRSLPVFKRLWRQSYECV